jgi:hypothetical protein
VHFVNVSVHMQGLEVAEDSTCRCNARSAGPGCAYCEAPGSCGRAPGTPGVCALLQSDRSPFGVANITCQPDELDLASCESGCAGGITHFGV